MSRFPRAVALALVAGATILLSAAASRERATGRAEPRITPVAPMAVARMSHTATTLGDGRVLIAGGFAGRELAAHSAELYDPRTERFTPLPPMRATRLSHTATPLPDGRVLLTGGYTDGMEVTASAEIYDPKRGTFAATGSMTSARAGHVAVALRDGSVLLVGGVGPGWTFLASAERYDPTIGRFTPVDDMAVARESHVAVRLPDGRVLVVGGHRGRREQIELFASAELFDPTTNRFTPTGAMQRRRHKHDAVALADGRVFVSGGADERDNRGVYTDSEIYDARTGAFSAGPALQRGRYKHAASSVLLPDGTVLLAGGHADAERVDVRTGTSTIIPGDERIAGQFSATALLPGGAVLLTGGYGANLPPQRKAWRYRP